jgi:hypothetical protein
VYLLNDKPVAFLQDYYETWLQFIAESNIILRADVMSDNIDQFGEFCVVMIIILATFLVLSSVFVILPLIRYLNVQGKEIGHASFVCFLSVVPPLFLTSD